MALAPGASAQTAPASVTITDDGVPQVGDVLTATVAWTGEPEPTFEWEWRRCDASEPDDCARIDDAASDSYLIVAADVGKVVQARIRVPNGRDSPWSAPTSVIQPAPDPEPTPSPTPTPSPDPDDPPTEIPPTPFDPPARPVFDPPPAGSDPPLLRPFPVVRIRGVLTPVGARVTLLTVRSPRGARIAARCRGWSCPVRRLARIARPLTRLRPLERRLRAGTRLDITVRKAGYIGKWTTIVIRRGRPPRRADRCVKPGRSRPTACPLG